MHKKELVEKLRKYVDDINHGSKDTGNWKGQRAFAKYLIDYLEALVIPSDEKYDFWDIDNHLPQILTDAFEHLRTGTDGLAIFHRDQYVWDTQHNVPNILDLGVSDSFERASAIQTTLQFLIKDIIGESWIDAAIDAYCNAQLHVLQHTFDKFVREVYRKGMYEAIDKCEYKGMAGKFGETELRSYTIAGRIMFTFARRRVGETIYSAPNVEDLTLPYIEESVSFVAEDGDPLALSAGMQSIHTDFVSSLAMIEDVVKNWPKDTKEQHAVYQASENVSMI